MEPRHGAALPCLRLWPAVRRLPSAVCFLLSALCFLPSASAQSVGAQIKTTDGAAEQPRLTVESGFATVNAYFQNALVGIGTTAPGRLLHLFASNAALAIEDSNSGGRRYVLTNLAGGDGSMGLYDQNAAAFRWLVTSGGNVGFGTTVPGAKLDVVGGLIRGNAGLTVSAGTVSLPSGEVTSSEIGSDLDFVNFQDTLDLDASTTANLAGFNFVFDLTGTGDFDIRDAGTSVFFVRDDGNIGINTTAPAGKVDIRGGAASDSFAVVADTTNGYLTVSGYNTPLRVADNSGAVDKPDFLMTRGSSSEGHYFRFANNTGDQYDIGVDGSRNFFIEDSRPGTDVVRLLIDTSGRVGIGGTPDNTLDVVGDAQVSTNLYFGTAGAVLSGANQGGSLELGPSNSAGGETPFIDFHFGAGSAQDYNIRMINSADNRLDIGTIGSGTVLTVSGANVGIGSTAPGVRLDVAGTGTTGIRYIKSGSADARIGVGDPTKTWSMAVGWSAVGAGNLSFIEEGVQGDTFVIKQGGNIGISSSNPAAKLDVNGSTLKYNGVLYTLPSAQGGVGTVLTNNGSGGLSWGTGGSGITSLGSGTAGAESGSSGLTFSSDPITSTGTLAVANNALDFSHLENALDLDATTTVAMGGFNFAFTGTGNVGIGSASPAFKLDVNSAASDNARIGAAELGGWPANSAYAYVGHEALDHSNAGNYALLQHSGGTTYVNAASGTSLNLRIANSTQMSITSGTLSASANLVPDGSNSRNLGSSGNKWQELYLDRSNAGELLINLGSVDIARGGGDDSIWILPPNNGSLHFSYQRTGTTLNFWEGATLVTEISGGSIYLRGNPLYCRSAGDTGHGIQYTATAPDGPVIFGWDGVKFEDRNGGATLLGDWNTTRLYVNGRVGIGSTSPQSVLDFGGNVSVGTDTLLLPRRTTDGTDPSAGLAEGMIYYNAVDNQFLGYNGTSWVDLGAGGGGGVGGSGTLNYVAKWTPDGSTLGNSQIFDNASNVGINSTSPGAKLDIVGGGGSTIDLRVNGRIHSNSASGGIWVNTTPNQFFGTINSTTMGLYNTAWNLALTSGGLVGIGTTVPSGRLDVLAGAARTGTHGTTPSFYVTGTLATGQTGPAANNIEFRHDNGTQGIGFGYNTIYQTGSNTNQELNLLSRGSSPITLNAYAYSTGNVGIASTAPGEKLDVVGNSRVSGNSYIGTTGAYFYSDASGRIATPSTFYVQPASAATYLYSTDTYLGNTSGDTIRTRGNPVRVGEEAAGQGATTGGLVITNYTADTGSDGIKFYEGATRVGEIGTTDTSWLRINQITANNIYTPRMFRADAGFQCNSSAASTVILGSTTANTTNPPQVMITNTTTNAASLDANIEFLLKRDTYAGMGIVSSDATASFIHFGDLGKADNLAIEYWNSTSPDANLLDKLRIQTGLGGGTIMSFAATTGNVGINTYVAGNKLEIRHGTSGNSGLRFTNLTSANSPSAASGGKVLGLDSSGNVIMVTDATGSGSLPSGTANNSTLRYDTGSAAWLEETDHLVTTSGQVLIGTTAAGAAYVSMDTRNSTTHNEIRISSANDGTSVAQIALAQAGTSYWNITKTGAEAFAITRAGVGDALTITETGRQVSHPGHTKIRVRKNADQTIANNSNVKVTWNTEIFDTLGEFASDRFTATYAGYYQIDVQVYWETNTTNAWAMDTYINGVASAALNYPSAAVSSVNGNGLSLGASGLVYMNAGDYFEIFVWQNSGGNATLRSTDGATAPWTTARNYLTIYRVP